MSELDDAVGLQVLRRPGLHSHPDSPLLLRRQHVHQHRRSHLRHPLLVAGLQPDSRFHRQQSPADARATVRHIRLLPCDSKNRGRRNLRSGNCGSSKKIPVRVRPARNRSCRLPHMVQNIGNLCRRLKNRGADLTQQLFIIRQFQPVQTKPLNQALLQGKSGVFPYGKLMTCFFQNRPRPGLKHQFLLLNHFNLRHYHRIWLIAPHMVCPQILHTAP